MFLDVSAAQRTVGVPVPFSHTVPLEASLLQAASAGAVEWLSPAEFTGEVLALGDASDTIVLRAQLRASYTANCARCLTDFASEFSAQISETFVKLPREDLPDAYEYEGASLDVTETLALAVFAGLPMRQVCREDCPGLCPICGAPKAERTCSCQTEAVQSSPWSALLAFRQDDEEV